MCASVCSGVCVCLRVSVCNTHEVAGCVLCAVCIDVYRGVCHIRYI